MPLGRPQVVLGVVDDGPERRVGNLGPQAVAVLGNTGVVAGGAASHLFAGLDVGGEAVELVAARRAVLQDHHASPDVAVQVPEPGHVPPDDLHALGMGCLEEHIDSPVLTMSLGSFQRLVCR